MIISEREAVRNVLYDVEEDIVVKFVTGAFVEKEYAKIVNESGGWSPKMIHRLLSSVYHELICEEMWNVLKAFKNQTVNFRVLNNMTIARIKQVKPEIFGWDEGGEHYVFYQQKEIPR